MGTEKMESVSLKFGGARRDRTADLNTASVALSQLSYGPLYQRTGILQKYNSVSSPSPLQILDKFDGFAQPAERFITPQ